MKRILSLTQKKYQQHKEFIKFGIVGGFGTVLNTVLFWLLTTFSTMHYVFASVIATEAAIISNFFGNHFFTFKNTKNKLSFANKFLLFQAVSMVTLVGTVAILWGLTTAFGQELLLVWNLTAIVVMFLANYTLNKAFTWGNKKENTRKRTRKTPALLARPGRLLSVLFVVLIGSIVLFGTARAETLTIQSTPVEASVFLNNTSYGDTDATGELIIPGLLGEYELLVTKAGYQDHTETVTIVNGTNETVSVTLTAATGSLDVETTPTGADITINGTAYGAAPVTVTGLQPGTYTIEATLTGYEDANTTATVTAGATEDVAITLTPVTPKNGTLNITTTPTGASITIDGNAAGVAPLSAELAPGTYTIEATLTGYDTETDTVTVTSEQTTDLALTLTETAKNATITFVSTPTGAEVSIDTVSIGTTPLSYEIAPGTYDVVISEAGYDDYTQTLTVAEAENTTVNATLQAADATLIANVTPENGSLFLNNTPYPVSGSSITLEDITPGVYDIKYYATGYEPYMELGVTFGQGAVIERTISLTPYNATLNVTTTQENVTITVDGQSSTENPAVFSLTPGTYTVQASSPGYDSSIQVITLGAEEYKELAMTVSEHMPTIMSTSTTITEFTVQGNNTTYTILETETHTFDITLDEPDTITWSINGETIETDVNSTSASLTWTPGIFYSNQQRMTEVVATTSSQQNIWYVNVLNVVNPFFDESAPNSPHATVHVIAYAHALNFSNLTVSVETIGDESQTNIHVLAPTTSGDDVDWSLTIENIPKGTSYIRDITAYEPSTGTTHTFTLGDERSHYRSNNIGDENNEFKHETARFSSSNGGGGGAFGGAYWYIPVEETLELVYAVFEEVVVAEDSTQTITIDAKIDTGDVTKAQATIFTPEKETRVIELELVKGDGTYGTWSADFSGFVLGEYKLEKIELWGENKDPTEFPVTDRQFYVEGDFGVFVPKDLNLVYTALSTGTATNGTNITLTLDAEDGVGVLQAYALVETNRDESFTVDLTRIEGDGNYGTWEAIITATSPDTTYTVKEVVLVNENEEKTFAIEDRSFYVEAIPYVAVKGNYAAPNLLTGAIAHEIFSPAWVEEMRKKPLLPTALAFTAMFLIIAVAFVGAAVHKRVRRTHEA